MPVYETTVTDSSNVPVAGASGYIYVNGVLADLTDDLGAPLANPVVTDALGYVKATVPSSNFTVKWRWQGLERRVETFLEGGFDSSLRAELATDDGASMIGEAEGGTLQDKIIDLSASFDATVAATETAQAAAEAAAELAGDYGDMKVYRTWALLNAVTGTAGDMATVLTDTGTHTDPVVGWTVSNSGIFSYVASPAGWQRIGNTSAADAAASAAAISASEAAIVRTEDQLMDFAPRRQLFDPSAATDGFFVNSTGGLNAHADYAASEWIPWPKGVTQVTMSRGNWLVQGALAGGTISAVSGTNANPNSNNYTLTKHSSATHFRVSVLKTVFTTANFSIEPGAGPLASTKPPFGKLVNGAALLDSTVPTAALADDAVTVAKAAFVSLGKNLFNKATTTANSGQGTGGVIVATGRQLSDYIDIRSYPDGTVFTYGAAGGVVARFRAVFDSSFVNRGAGYSTDTNGTTSYTKQAGDAYMRLTYEDAFVPSAQVEVGATQTSYEAYGQRLTSDILNAVQPSKWANKAFLSYGDSLTAQLEWQPEISEKLGLLHTAAGVGGRRVSGASGMNVQATIDALPVDQDLIIVLGGTNDWAASVPLGAPYTTGTSGGLPTITLNTNVNEFYGALNVMVQRLQTKYPTGRLCLAAPPWSEMPSRVTAGTWAQDSVNLQGLTIVEYGDAIAAVARFHGLPFIDFRETGINATNNETYMKNDGDWLHPNSTHGGPRMAEVAIGRLNDIEPLV